MESQRRFIAKYLGDGKGATAVEYAIIAAGIALAIAAAVVLLGSAVVTKFDVIETNVQ